MKKRITNIIKASVIGIGIACIIYTVIGIIIDLSNGSSILYDNWAFSKQALGTILIGIGFSAPSEIYNNDKLPFPFQVIFHMGIGCTIYLITAFNVGWIPVEIGWINCLLIIVGQLFVAFLIWLGFALHYRTLAKDMNEKIREKSQES